MNACRLYFFWIVILSIAVCQCKGQSLQHAAGFKLQDFDAGKVAEKLITHLADSVTGFAFEISRDNKILVSRAGGYKTMSTDMANGTPVPFDCLTRFHVASVSKTITALAIAKLKELGKLSYNDSISKYLPGSWKVHPLFAHTTIADLLTMKSGLSGPLDARSSCYDSLKAYIERGPDPKQVGKFLYQNISYGLLRVITAEAVDPGPYSRDDQDEVLGSRISASYIKFVNEYLFKPAGIAQVYCHETGPLPVLMYAYPSPNRHGYLTGRDNLVNDGNLDAYAGALGWYLSVQELGRFLRAAFTGHKIITEKSMRDFFALGFPLKMQEAQFGEFFGSGGDWMTPLGLEPRGGIHTYYYRFPYNIQIVVVTNSGEHGLRNVVLDSFDAGIKK